MNTMSAKKMKPVTPPYTFGAYGITISKKGLQQKL